MKSRAAIIAAVLLIAGMGIALQARDGDTQGAGASLTVGIYAPTIQFDSSAARLAYAQALGKAIASNTGAKVDARSFTSLAQLRKANVDFAIVDGQCYAANSSWPLLANAHIGGKTTRGWALYSSVGPEMSSLKGKKLAFVKTGCRDTEFIDNAMLESEVGSGFFSGRVGKPDLNGAVAEVASYKGAEAVFAPTGAQKGLTKVFDTGAVPLPAFVQVNGSLAAPLVEKVTAAVVGYGGGGAIDGWKAGSAQTYSALRGRMAKKVKRGSFAAPDPVRVDASDILIEPRTLDEHAMTEIVQHFEVPPERQ